ncbi:hypothetical protein JCM6882_005039 [Rhodosporidiobolus microsporus]
MPRPLPPELVRDILELLAPEDAYANDYRQAQDQLRRCCLVSQAFRALAQPLLWRAVHIASTEGSAAFQAAVAAESALSTHVRTVKVRSKPSESDTGLVEVVRRLPRVMDLKVVVFSPDEINWNRGELPDFSGHKALQHLTLSGFTISTLSSHPPPSLVTLSLDISGIRLEPLAQLLSPSTTPALRAVYFGTIPLSPGVMPRAPFLLEPALTRRLDVVHVSSFSLDFLLLDFTQPTPILTAEDPLNALVERRIVTGAEYLRLEHPGILEEWETLNEDYTEALCQSFDGLAQAISTSSVLRAVSLPPSFLPSSSMPERIRLRWHGVVQALWEKEVDFVWRAEGEADGVDRRFWRYLQKKKGRGVKGKE